MGSQFGPDDSARDAAAALQAGGMASADVEEWVATDADAVADAVAVAASAPAAPAWLTAAAMAPPTPRRSL
jgi:hypothetical protein